MRFAWAALVLACVACTRPVDVTGSPSDEGCDPFLAALPVQILGETMRETVPTEASAAAWGDPPIIVRCGVSTPATLAMDSGLVEVEGITWFPEPLTNGTLFTTVGIRPVIELTVPRDYAPEVNTLLEVAPAVLAHTTTS